MIFFVFLFFCFTPTESCLFPFDTAETFAWALLKNMVVEYATHMLNVSGMRLVFTDQQRSKRITINGHIYRYREAFGCVCDQMVQHSCVYSYAKTVLRFTNDHRHANNICLSPIISVMWSYERYEGA